MLLGKSCAQVRDPRECPTWAPGQDGGGACVPEAAGDGRGPPDVGGVPAGERRGRGEKAAPLQDGRGGLPRTRKVHHVR